MSRLVAGVLGLVWGMYEVLRVDFLQGLRGGSRDLAIPYKLAFRTTLGQDIHIYKRKHTHACIHAYIHAYIHTYIHTYTDICIHIQINLYIYIYIYV